MSARTQFEKADFASAAGVYEFNISDDLQGDRIGEAGVAFMRCVEVTGTTETYHLVGIRIDESYPISLSTWHDRKGAISCVGLSSSTV